MLQPGYSRSPFQEGFAALREEPLLFAAELTWRWCFAIAAWLIVLLAAALFLDSLKLSQVDRFLLSTTQPALAGSALSHILSGALLRYLWIKFFVLLGITVMWAFAAAVGRAASLRSLVSLTGGDDCDEDVGWQFRAMLQLHLLRALWIWIAIGCFFASLLIGHEMMQSGRAARGAFFYVFGVAFSLVFGVMLNWIFSLAPLFCIRNQVRRSRCSITDSALLHPPGRTLVRLVAGVSRVANGLGWCDVSARARTHKPWQPRSCGMGISADGLAVPDLSGGSRCALPCASWS